jgi:hypothetical protein
LIHNACDALTAIPLGVAFILRSVRGEKIVGLAVVFAILVSAMVALNETIMRFVHPEQLSHLRAFAAAGVIGFLGNEVAAQVRLAAGRRLASAAMIAEGKHALTDGFVSLGWSSARSWSRSVCKSLTRSLPRDHADHPSHHLGVLARGSPRRNRPRVCR